MTCNFNQNLDDITFPSSLQNVTVWKNSFLLVFSAFTATFFLNSKLWDLAARCILQWRQRVPSQASSHGGIRKPAAKIAKIPAWCNDAKCFEWGRDGNLAKPLTFLTIKEQYAKDIWDGKKLYEATPPTRQGVGKINVGDLVAFHWYRPIQVVVRVTEIISSTQRRPCWPLWDAKLCCRGNSPPCPRLRMLAVMLL